MMNNKGFDLVRELDEGLVSGDADQGDDADDDNHCTVHR